MTSGKYVLALSEKVLIWEQREIWRVWMLELVYKWEKGSGSKEETFSCGENAYYNFSSLKNKIRFRKKLKKLSITEPGVRDANRENSEMQFERNAHYWSQSLALYMNMHYSE